MECSEKQDELQVEWNFLKVGAEWGDGDELSDIEGEGADGDGGDVLEESGVDVGSSFLHHSSVPVTPVSAVVRCMQRYRASSRENYSYMD